MDQDPEAWSGYDERLETSILGIMLKQARLDSGLTQEEKAKRLKTPPATRFGKPVVSNSVVKNEDLTPLFSL
jgi:hypothetical protein